MGDVLCVGLSHHPGFGYPDENMADILRRHLANERIPAEAKDPRRWPSAMVDEYGPDGARATDSARKHRDKVISAVRAVRDEIDAFQPDVVVIWGDDQYENFHEDIVPPFCVFIAEQFETTPFKRGAPWALNNPTNIWNEPADKVFTQPGHPDAARHLTRRLLEAGFAVPYAYKPLHYQGMAHAFMNSLMYLDYDRVGFPYPVIPFHVNCYGSAVIRNRGGDSLGKPTDTEPDPPAPSPRLCFEIGAATARIFQESPYRAVLVGSSSWSHAFLTKKHHFIYPDVEADRQRAADLMEGRFAHWRELDLGQIEDSGQHELLNWVCLAGAMHELGRTPEVLDFSESFIFNSSKCTLVARPEATRRTPVAAGSAGAR